MEQQKSIFGPLLLIAAGAVWLLVQSGSIPAANLWALTHIWPYLLIAAGLGLILRSFWKYTSIFLDVLIIGGAVLAIVFAPQLGWASPTLSSFVFGDGDFVFGPGEPGSGKVVSENRMVGEFDEVEVNFPGRVVISQGESASVKVEAEDNFLPGLKTEVRDGRLEIFYKVKDGERVNPTKPVTITIVVTDLKRLDFNSAGEITITGVETDELEISVDGAGSLKLNDIAVSVLALDLSGAGSVDASGTADELGVSISGFGSFNGGNLHSQTAEVSLSGAGSATVWVDEALDAEISGAGSVNYYGSPSVTKQIGGVGDVKRLGDK